MMEFSVDDASCIRSIAQEAAESCGPRVRSRRNKEATPPAQDNGRTVNFQSLPAYLKDNEFIRGSYRRVLPVRDSFWSLFGLHNETGNIYTHLFGAQDQGTAKAAPLLLRLHGVVGGCMGRGFLLFLALTVYVARLPPTPLAFGHSQIDALWLSVRGMNMDRLQEGVNSLQEGLSEKVHILQEGLSETVHGLSEGLSETVHGLSERVLSLQEGLSERARSLRQHVDSTLGLPGGARDAYETLAGLLNWPTVRWVDGVKPWSSVAGPRTLMRLWLT